jgi:hypothetical protein
MIRDWEAGGSANDYKGPATFRTEAKDGEVVIERGCALYAEPAHNGETCPVDYGEVGSGSI